MKQTLKQGKYDRIEKYERSGHGYEEGRYGSRFRNMYLRYRSATLLGLLSDAELPLTRILEVGCGTGLTLQFLAESTENVNLHGVDISESMLQQAKAKFANRRQLCDFSIASAFDLPFDDATFDALYNTRFMHQFTFEEQTHIHIEFSRVVRPGGLIISEFYGGRQKRHVDHLRHQERYPTLAEVRAIVATGFQCIPLSFRGAQVLANRIGTAPAMWILAGLRRMPFNPLVHEYFVVVRRPENI